MQQLTPQSRLPPIIVLVGICNSKVELGHSYSACFVIADYASPCAAVVSLGLLPRRQAGGRISDGGFVMQESIFLPRQASLAAHARFYSSYLHKKEGHHDEPTKHDKISWKLIVAAVVVGVVQWPWLTETESASPGNQWQWQ
ncbi:uncharacterized protein LOC122007125 [Zingiber officinale]|uniref:uncharacterized protein LOC122007125 n=1 Tax=Zingiber officinale TaxID=94328 RepID=UPI001C4B6C98|nr:uncharacterized protein LOC122007125 [Zingiber officinale]